ncbi:MAG: intradiol ring-cleavage dioxygenase [Candidatus Eremiobacteraeota bacterium]|nr:intradiol ring-cleavage dioxygenase [Candidatus Eremiobacteraeota bacterium]
MVVAVSVPGENGSVATASAATVPAEGVSTLTDDVVASAAACDDARLRFVFETLVRHLHAFVEEVELTSDEWLEGVRFLTATGHKCDEYRQEFMMLSDTLGVTSLVDEIAHRASTGASESSVLGPFYTENPPGVAHGESIAAPGCGVPLDVRGHVRDADGAGIAGAALDVWGTDGDGLYDSQHSEHVVDCRGRVRTTEDGSFAFKTVVPQSYSIPTDGPVGAMLQRLGRHTFRPAHLHFRITAEGFAPLTTAIYAAGDPYLASDAVFGVRTSLIEEFRHGDASGTATLERDFTLAKTGAT